MCDVQVADYLLGISDQIAQFNRNKLLVVGDFNLPGHWLGSCYVRCRFCSRRKCAFWYDARPQTCTSSSWTYQTWKRSCSLLDLVFLERSFSNYSVSMGPGLSEYELIVASFSLNGTRTRVHDTHPPTIVKKFCAGCWCVNKRLSWFLSFWILPEWCSAALGKV